MKGTPASRRACRPPRVACLAAGLGLAGATGVGGLGCGGGRNSTDDREPPPQKTAENPAAAAGDRPGQAPDAAHRVVFADRSSMGYLLLLPGDAHPGGERPAPPTREAMQDMVREAFAGHLDDDEVRLLLGYIALDPSEGERPVEIDPDDPQASMRAAAAGFDLIGIYVEVVPVDAVISELALEDPLMLRGLAPQARAGLAERRWALLLRGDYRARHAFRGLRLLQTLVRVVATELDALVHDPDTLETMDVDTFTRRRLQSSLGNVIDQIVVVPFPDPRHGEGHLRLSTRGMRRFGAVDLELDALPRDPRRMQQATDLLHGLAMVLAREAEVTETGVAVEVDEAITVHWRDVEAAYRPREARPERCADCPEQTLVHLVERPSEPHDPQDHVVARVVAPRSQSDLPGYDHPAWVAEALRALFGA